MGHSREDLADVILDIFREAAIRAKEEELWKQGQIKGKTDLDYRGFRNYAFSEGKHIYTGIKSLV